MQLQGAQRSLCSEPNSETEEAKSLIPLLEFNDSFRGCKRSITRGDSTTMEQFWFKFTPSRYASDMDPMTSTLTGLFEQEFNLLNKQQ